MSKENDRNCVEPALSSFWSNSGKAELETFNCRNGGL